LFGKQAAAFFLIQEDDRLKRKSFRTGGRECRGSIGTAQLASISTLFDFGIRVTVEHNQKSEPCALEGFSLSSPGVDIRSWRIVLANNRNRKRSGEEPSGLNRLDTHFDQTPDASIRGGFSAGIPHRLEAEYQSCSDHNDQQQSPHAN
jgi:hypothetical protein